MSLAQATDFVNSIFERRLPKTLKLMMEVNFNKALCKVAHSISILVNF